MSPCSRAKLQLTPGAGVRNSGLLQKNADCSPEGHHSEGDKWRKANRKVKGEGVLKRGRTSVWLFWGALHKRPGIWSGP